jgi:signal transduction histidine kinase
MNARDLIATGLYLIPALLFVEVSREQWNFRRRHGPRSRAFRLIPIVTTVLAVHYLILAARALVPGRPVDPIDMIRTPGHVLFEDPWLVALALLRHLLYLLPLPERRPSTAWLVGNYGLALGAAALSGYLRLHPGATPDQQELAHHVFEVGFSVLGVLCAIQFSRNARPGTWRPEYAGEMRRPDVVLVRALGGAAFLAFPLVWALGGREFALIGFEVLLGLAVAAPMITRVLGHVIPGVIVTGGLGAGTIGIVAGYTALIARVPPELHPVVGFGAVVAILVLFSPGRRALDAVARRVILRQREDEMQTLQRCIHTLTLDLGVVECCRRILAEVVRVRRIPGAAIVLAEGEPIVEGAIDVDVLLRVWPRGGAAVAMPRGAYGSSELRDMPLPIRDAILDAGVGLGIAAIDSPRRRWGHLFMCTGFFGGMFREDDADALAVLMDELALVLDGADLLARTVSVERSLAHAEKLATIGELAARFAHDIRNPVTAARSLAQQLARDPAAPENAEHAGIILTELERVERQVRDLLRFARREEYQLAPVDLGRLAHATVTRLASRLDAAGVTATCTVPAGVVVQADRDKLDHVLVNLVENAIDAVAERPERKVALVVEREDGRARMRVTDSGPGVPADVLGHVFEPFYSRKPNGTGLGLAIAKRTVDGHGGRIDVEQRAGEGLTFTIELPLATEVA